MANKNEREIVIGDKAGELVSEAYAHIVSTTRTSHVNGAANYSHRSDNFETVPFFEIYHPNDAERAITAKSKIQATLAVYPEVSLSSIQLERVIQINDVDIYALGVHTINGIVIFRNTINSRVRKISIAITYHVNELSHVMKRDVVIVSDITSAN